MSDIDIVICVELSLVLKGFGQDSYPAWFLIEFILFRPVVFLFLLEEMLLVCRL